MRYLPFLLLAPLALGGCATGYLLDRFEGREEIIQPQLLRFGLPEQQASCVAQRLSRRLSYGSLRALERRAAAIDRGLRDPGRLSTNDLIVAANNVGDREVRLELDNSMTTCGVQRGTLAGVAPPTQTPAAAAASPAAPASGRMMSGGVPVDMTPLPGPGASTGAAAAAATWLNLGSAESGQSIAIDAMSIQQEGGARIAWFRMTDPESGQPTNNNYRLRIDCEARTVQPLALRQTDAAGTQVSLREYTPAEAAAGPAEAGTVLEIAYLSLCT